MYGIPDFEAKFEAVPESELTPNLNLSTELGRIPWPQERQEFMPKPMSKNKFAYKGDFLSDRLVEQQERAQAFQNTLMVLYFHNFIITVGIFRINSSTLRYFIMKKRMNLKVKIVLDSFKMIF